MLEVMDRQYAIRYITPKTEPENAIPMLLRVYMPLIILRQVYESNIARPKNLSLNSSAL
jgi:hypothetical protein